MNVSAFKQLRDKSTDDLRGRKLLVSSINPQMNPNVYFYQQSLSCVSLYLNSSGHFSYPIRAFLSHSPLDLFNRLLYNFSPNIYLAVFTAENLQFNLFAKTVVHWCTRPQQCRRINSARTVWVWKDFGFAGQTKTKDNFPKLSF